MTAVHRYASPIDAFTYGEYRITATTEPGPRRRRFDGRVGSQRFRAEPGRYHLYAGWFCPRSHRATIVRALHGLADVVSVSYVHGLRDARGWAFREPTGPDPVSGFTLLRQAYEAGEVGYAGPVTVPVLWDRATGRIVTNDPDTIDVDLATAFATWAMPGADTYPVAHRPEIDEANRHVQALGQLITRAVYQQGARTELRSALRDLDRRLAGRRYLVGERLTLADVRLWVLLVRYDVGANATGAAGPPLASFADLWTYARGLYAHPAFRTTTDFSSFAAPLTPLPEWDAPVRRGAA